MSDALLNFDYTRLFAKRTLRNPLRWSDVPIAKFIGPKQSIALLRIANEGILELKENVLPADNMFPSYKTAHRIEWLITRPPVMLFLTKSVREFYYVNTSGGLIAYNVLRLPFGLISQIIPELPSDP